MLPISIEAGGLRSMAKMGSYRVEEEETCQTRSDE